MTSRTARRAETRIVVAFLCTAASGVALKRGRTQAVRVVALVTALLTVAFLFTVARAHHPLGIFAML